MTPQEIGQRVKALRTARQWTLQALSRRSKVSISALSKIENAQVAASFDTLLRIARGFGIGFDAMLQLALAEDVLEVREAVFPDDGAAHRLMSPGTRLGMADAPSGCPI